MANTVSEDISDQSLNRIIQVESAGKPEAKASTSTATGLFQFLSQTWLGTLKRHAPKNIADRIVKRGSRWVVPDGGERQLLDMRKGTTPKLRAFNIEMGARFTEDNARALGPGWNDGDLYLAHFSGIGVAKALLRGSPTDRVDQPGYYSDSEINANRSILLTRVGTDARGRPIYGKPAKTVAQVRAWAETLMRSKWEKAGKPDWIKKYWLPVHDEALELPEEREDHPPVKMEDASPEPTPPHGERSQDIRDVQTILKELKYHEVGSIDGKWGGRTRAAIAAYKNDRHLEGPTVIDEELVADLKRALGEGWSRPMAPERTEATDAKIEKEVPAAKDSAWTRFWAKIATWTGVGGGGGIGIADFVSDHSDEAASWWNKVNDLMEKIGVTDVPVWAWILIGGLICGLIWKSASTADTKIKEAYRDGEVM